MPESLRHTSSLAAVPVYFGLTLLIGWFARRRNASANDYLNASRSLPLWIVVSSFLAANCGALEIVGLSALAAEYGVQAFQFYWLGAIPALVVLSLWVMPAYMKSGIRSAPEYLERRFGFPVRLLYAAMLAVMMLVLAGINLYAMAEVLQAMLGLRFILGASLGMAVVLTYTLWGGVRATIYNEVFQLAVMVVGLVPLAFHVYRYAWPGSRPASSAWHLWKMTPLVNPRASFDSLGLIIGLGFVLSFGYWCTDFVQIQRALAARTDADARQVPLWAGFGKLVFSLIVVLPGLAAYQMLPHLATHRRFDQTLPAMLASSYGPVLLSIGLTALVASLTSGLAANVSAFASVWTQDIYRSYIRKHENEEHYRRMGQGAMVFAIAFSLGGSFMSFWFKNVMDEIQMLFSLSSAPFWAIFLLGMATRRTTLRGAFWGALAGIGVAIVHCVFVWRHWIVYGSVMSANFYGAIYAFCTALCVGWLISAFANRAELSGTSDFRLDPAAFLRGKNVHWLWALALALLMACMALNVLWR